MQIRVAKRSPLPLKDQIKRQIRALVRGGELREGQALPSARDLAAVLGVNRNTVAAVYRELGGEGVLESVVGSGTYVRKVRPAMDPKPLDEVFGEAIRRARGLGFSPQEIVDGFLTRMALETAREGPARVLVVECQHETANEIAGTLEQELGVETETVLIQDLEADPRGAMARLQGKNLVVCGVNHVREVRAVAPESTVEVLGVFLTSDVRLANEVARLAEGTRVGVTCVNERAAGNLSKAVPIGKGSTLTKIWTGADDPAGLRKLIESCDVVFASNFVYDRAAALAGPATRVIRVEIGVTEASLELVRERLLRGRGPGAEPRP